jgi:hypothetical protein
VQATGSIINIAWIDNMGVTDNSLCIAQAAIKQTGNVGTAIWSLVIAIHTFCLLFCHTHIPNWFVMSQLCVGGAFTDLCSPSVQAWSPQRRKVHSTVSLAYGAG